MAVEIGGRNDREEKRGEERPPGGDARAGQPRKEVADEACGDHHRPRRDERDGHCIQELALGEPVVLQDQPTMQEGHDRETTAEDEASCVCKESKNLQQEEDTPRLSHGTPTPEDRRWRADQPHQSASSEDERHRLAPTRRPLTPARLESARQQLRMLERTLRSERRRDYFRASGRQATDAALRAAANALGIGIKTTTLAGRAHAVGD
jgi:hypothetical protein